MGEIVMSTFKITALTASILLATACGSSISYAAPMTNQQIKAMVNTIVNQRTAKLQKEVKKLQNQVVTLKGKLSDVKQQVRPGVMPVSQHGLTVKNIPKSRQAIGTPSKHVVKTKSTVGVARNNVLTGLYLGGTPVFTSPYIGEHSAFDGSDLIVNQSTVNFDVRLLKQEQALRTTLAKKGLPLPQHPLVELSGEVEGLGNVRQTHPGNTKAGINLSDAELDVYAQVNPWVLGFVDFSWEDSLPAAYRIARDNVFVDKAFVTIGDLTATPWYASLGQLYVPFGQYSSYMISDPVTKLLARTQARSMVLGYRPQNGDGVFAASYVFQSNTRDNAKSADGGVNLGYEFDHDGVSGKLAVGAIANIADAQGMQMSVAPSNTPFTGFGTSSSTEQIYKAVPAVDVHGSLNIDHYSFIAEYVDSTTDFDPRAMTFNGKGARVSAGHVEAAYNFHWHGKPGSFSVSYGYTQEALALFLPRDRYMAALNYSFWRNTVASVEFRHDVQYAGSNRASGAGSAVFGPQHKYLNLATVQFGVFF